MTDVPVDESSERVNYLLVERATRRVIQGGTCAAEHLERQAWDPATQVIIPWELGYRTFPQPYLGELPPAPA